MRDYSGVPTAALANDLKGEDLMIILRNQVIAPIDYYLRDLSRGQARIQKGQVPDGSGTLITDIQVSDKFWLLLGRPGNQIGYGGTRPAGTATIASTTDSTKGYVYLGNSSGVSFDETNARVGIAKAVPAAKLHIVGAVALTQSIVPFSDIQGGDWTGQDAGTTNLFSYVDESSPDDSDYLQFSFLLSHATLEFSLGTIVNPGVLTGFTLKVRALYTGANPDRVKFDQLIIRDAVNTTLFDGNNTAIPDPPGITNSFVTYTIPVTFAATPSSWTGIKLLMSMASDLGGPTGTGKISWVQFIAPLSGSSSSTEPLQKWDNGVTLDTLAFSNDGAGGIDLNLTGNSELFVDVGDQTSGLRIYTNSSTAYLEAGTSAQAAMNLRLGGVRATTGTLATFDFTNVLLKGALQLEDPGAGTNAITLTAPTTPTTQTLTLPASIVNTGVLQVATGGALSWTVLTASSFPHVVLDSTVHTDTLTGTVVRGDLILGNSTPKWSRLAIGAANAFLGSNGTDASWTGAGALTRTDDTNVTLTLGGTPSTALLRAASLTLGWTGTLAASRGGTGVSSLASLTANPSASVGLSTVNGSASTFMRSDGAPPLSQAIAPTWTGTHIFDADSGGAPTFRGDASGAVVLFNLKDTSSGFTATVSFTGALAGNISLLVPNSAGTLITTQSTSTLANKTIAALKSASTWGGIPAVTGDGTSANISCTTQSTQTVLCAATAGIVIGQVITGSGIPTNNYVTGLTANVSFTIAVAATNSTTATRNFSPVTTAISGATGGGARINLTGVTANLSAVNLLLTNGAPGGYYQVNATLACTTANAGGAVVAFNLNWTDDSGGRAVGSLFSRSMTAVGSSQQTFAMYVSSGNITFTTSGWTAGTYALRVRTTYLGA